ncbi:cobalamin biosynthesis protein CbiX [Rhodoferax sp. 4810]|uniref:Cobalamin biosynthesis protein CbiX n=1 Tax=Thiospirillum jenense TaxID=1653858 RepID=A0A839H503_9GAMM|nr:CbiX/SirB N-terminal domain-containing protein [Thiospirillum jenense]MBB1076550.1 cobalamin biosynthesis protein CbiX [Rhodoferax jenense]MBB1124744.1 cobalamin biosynthesis protein CbiX [Thiospirillum jenense]
MTTILLVDNGSRRPESVLALRDLAARLTAYTGQIITPVSLQHSDHIDTALLDQRPAIVLTSCLRQQLLLGRRDFIILPLFFGPSRALTEFIPTQVAILQNELGWFDVRMAEVLCPLPAGEPLLVEILSDQLQHCISQQSALPDQIILVDHGSPVSQVTAVRTWLAQQLTVRLQHIAPVSEAVMERRSEREYDFNGQLLTEVLKNHAMRDPRCRITLSMLFFFAGRHAGQEGDIATICRTAMTHHSELSIAVTPLVGQHRRLIELLAHRLQAVNCA